MQQIRNKDIIIKNVFTCSASTNLVDEIQDFC